LVHLREIDRTAFWEFRNSICHNRNRCIAAALALCGTN
jgi:hypothetical protein